MEQLVYFQPVFHFEYDSAFMPDEDWTSINIFKSLEMANEYGNKQCDAFRSFEFYKNCHISFKVNQVNLYL